MSEDAFERGFVAGWEAAKRQHMKSVAEADKRRQDDDFYMRDIFTSKSAADAAEAAVRSQQAQADARSKKAQSDLRAAMSVMTPS